MFTEQQVRRAAAHRNRILLPTLAAAITLVFVYFLALLRFHDQIISHAIELFGEGARDIAVVALVLLAFTMFLLPLVIAERRAGLVRIYCPSCGLDVLSDSRQVLATRRCPSCERQVIEGQSVRRTGVYRRAMAIRMHAFVRYWLWVWPALGLLVVVWWAIDPRAFLKCPQNLWVFPLIGVTAAGWTWLRTFDHRVLPQLLSSAVLFALGGWLFWNSP